MPEPPWLLAARLRRAQERLADPAAGAKPKKPAKSRGRLFRPKPCRLCGKLTMKLPAKGKGRAARRGRGRPRVFCSHSHQGIYWSFGHPPQKIWNRAALEQAIARYRARRQAELEAGVEIPPPGRQRKGVSTAELAEQIRQGGRVPSRRHRLRAKLGEEPPHPELSEHLYHPGDPVSVQLEHGWRDAKFKARIEQDGAVWYEVRLEGYGVVSVWPGEIKPREVNFNGEHTVNP